MRERSGGSAIPLVLLFSFVVMVGQARAAVIPIDPVASGPKWEGLGAQIYVWMKGGLDFRGKTPAQMYDLLRTDLGVRYGRVMVHVEQQEYVDGKWNWTSAPYSNLDDTMWRSLGVMQAHGVEPIVTPIFWLKGIVADNTYPTRANNFLGTPAAYKALEDWFSQLCVEAPKQDYTPLLASIQNEPDNDSHLKFSTGQIGQAMRRIVSRLDAEGHPLRFVAADTATTRQASSYGVAQLVPGHASRVASVGFHTYGSDNRSAMVGALSGFGHSFWMTEQAFNTAPESQDSWEYVNRVGVDFFNDVKNGKATAWFLWSVGVRGEDVYDGSKWRPFAAAIGLVGRHVPLGARQVLAQKIGSLHVLGWVDSAGLYVWALNTGTTAESLAVTALGATGAQAWRVTAQEQFVPAGTGLTISCEGQSATMIRANWLLGNLTPTPVSTHTPVSTSTRTRTPSPAPATETPAQSTPQPSTPTALPSLSPTPTSGSAEVMRINAGGGDYVDSRNNLWMADREYKPGAWGFVGGRAYSTTSAISGTEDDPLYQNERYGMSRYLFTLPNARYRVSLHFAEIYFDGAEKGGAGKRIFDVFMLRTRVLDDLDLFVQAGPLHAWVHTADVQVTTGLLSIDFTATANNAAIDGIHLARLPPDTAPTASHTPPPSSTSTPTHLPTSTPSPSRTPTANPSATGTPAPTLALTPSPTLSPEPTHILTPSPTGVPVEDAADLTGDGIVDEKDLLVIKGGEQSMRLIPDLNLDGEADYMDVFLFGSVWCEGLSPHSRPR